MSAVSVLLSPRDEAIGARIADALSRDGHEVHVVPNDGAIGDLFGAKATDTSIVVWSTAALKLARLHDQAREALERGSLIPVAIGGAGVPEGFESVPPVDLSGWQGDDQDPRWRFVLEEISLAAGRHQLGDEDVWRAAESAPEVLQDVSEQAEEIDEISADAPASILSADENEWLEAPAPLAAPSAPRHNVMEARSVADAVLRAREPVVFSDTRLDAPVENDFAPPLPARARRKKPRRFEPAAVAVGGVMALCVMTGAAMIFAPSFQTVPQADNTPALREAEPFDLAVLQAPPEVLSDAVTGAIADDVRPGSAAISAAAPVNETPAPDLIGDIARSALVSDGDSGPDSIGETQSEAPDEPVNLAILGPISPGDDASVSEPSPPEAGDSAAAETSLDAILASVPEIADDIETAPAPAQQTEYAGEFFKDCSVCPDMRAIDGGTFMMGSAPGEAGRTKDEGPVRQITIAGRFAIGTREVTFEQWDACVADGGCASYIPPAHGWGRAKTPVVSVSMLDAQNYASWLSAKTGETYRLPSEAEWEFAARAGSDAPFSFGQALQPTSANYDARYAYKGRKGKWRGRPTAAATFAPNSLGLFDMHGNVWEWTADCWAATLDGIPAGGAPRTTGTCDAHVLKGGAWNTGGWRLRAGHRIGKSGNAREFDNGFRVVREL